MRKIAVRTKKGGVGKSTTTANVGYYLSRKGNTVCLVDIDSQFNLTTMLGVAQENVSQTLLDILQGASINNVAKEIRNNLFLVHSSSKLSFGDDVLTERPPEMMLRRRMNSLNPWDFIIFDCPPGESKLVTNVLCYVDEVWAPLQTQYLSLEGLSQVAEEIAANNKDFAPYGVKAKISYIIPTMLDKRTKLSKDVLEHAKEKYGGVVTEPIRRSVRLEESPSYGQTIFEHDPNGTGAEDYSLLAERILKNE